MPTTTTTAIVPSEAHPETMDFLSRAWCDFAVQTLQPAELSRDNNETSSIFAMDKPLVKFDRDVLAPAFLNMDKMDDPEPKSLPPWKSNDMKSWIWMQQAMHPELNYNRKKWVTWKVGPLFKISIKKWFKEMKLKRKEEDRLQRAEVHAAISVAGLAAALAAIAAGKSRSSTNEKTDQMEEEALANAAALVAAQCAKFAEAMGAKKDDLSSALGSAMSGTGASDILTLTAAATTSLKGAATLKARTECKNRFNGSAPVLPIEDSHDHDHHDDNLDLDFNKYRSMLASGSELHVETPDGDFRVRWISIILDNQSKVVLRMRKLNLFRTKKESIVLDIHAELYRDPAQGAQETDTCYIIVLSTNEGTIKLDMGDDYDRYKTWATAINHMLALSSNSYNKYELQFYKN
ncbi:unnamed protein product [Linum trigynum]|uniref:VAN3-binding protein n=1 Tax=Linum trigynum TaxID=586398 RepID=A0AAV2CPQ7_9ROSI